MREQFLANSRVVADALADTRVADAWDEPSALPGHTVGSLAAHLAFAIEVQQFLDYGVPDAPAVYEGAADYYARAIELLTDEVNRGIHERSDADAALGSAQVAGQAADRLAALPPVLEAEPSDRLIHLFGGTIALDDFLWTRIVEQVVHLDDLARSLTLDPGSTPLYVNPPDAEALVISIGAEIGRRRFGGPAMIRALFRDPSTSPSPLPVI